MFDSTFVPRGPQRPTDRRKPYLENPFRGPRQARGKGPKISKGGRVPRNLETGTDVAPNEFSQGAMKENMLRILKGTTQSTSVRARPIPFSHLVSRRQSAMEGLP